MLAALAGIAGIAVAVLVGAPLVGWPTVVRLPAILFPALALALLAMRPWRWGESGLHDIADWTPRSSTVAVGALMVGLILLWIVITRFESGEINAVDFTVYFDRPCFQTINGRPLFVEATDDIRFSHRGELTDHAYWAMFPLCSLYALHANPYWLLTISVLAVILGAVYVLRIVHSLGGGGLLAASTALAFVLNDNTARTLSYGFHPEVLFAWFIPWMIHAGLQGSRTSFVIATVACVLVKESACLPIFAVSAALMLVRFRTMTWLDRGVFLALPNVVALANLAMYYGWVIPYMTADGRPTYAYFWENYGTTPVGALLGMAQWPSEVAAAVATSGFFTLVLLPHLWLPLVGWRWMVGIMPIVLIFSASAAEQVRAFGIYYAIPLVPFLVIGASAGALVLTRMVVTHPARQRLMAAAAVLLGAILVGSGDRGYSLRPWKPEVAAVSDVLGQLSGETIVLVQSGLFPHAGYETHVRLLTRETLNDSNNIGAVVLIAPAVNAYPFESWEIERLRALQAVAATPQGILAVRLEPARLQEDPRLAKR